MSDKKLGVIRYRVVFTENGRTKSEETLNGSEPVASEINGYPVFIYTLQKNGDVRVVSTELVKRVVAERQQLPHGNWVKVDE